jgi:hypothetical protein
LHPVTAKLETTKEEEEEGEKEQEAVVFKKR